MKSKELKAKLVGMYETAQPCSEARQEFTDTLTTLVAICLLEIAVGGDRDAPADMLPT